jgi:hypothetical protein
MKATYEVAKPAIVRALSIYRAVAKHGSDIDTRIKLARHIVGLWDRGERDLNRLTVHGLTYLRSRDLRNQRRQRH